MGFHRHHILKCHTCKSRRAMGGSKKAGRFAGAKESSWAFTKVAGGLGYGSVRRAPANVGQRRIAKYSAERVVATGVSSNRPENWNRT
jgi:hypothetical protein